VQLAYGLYWHVPFQIQATPVEVILCLKRWKVEDKKRWQEATQGMDTAGKATWLELEC